jgi:hypothetical protein
MNRNVKDPICAGFISEFLSGTIKYVCKALLPKDNKNTDDLTCVFQDAA